MAFANPLVISVNAVNKSLIKINQDNYGSEYYLREATGEYRCKIRHTLEAKVVGTGVVHRSNVDITYTKFSTTPGVPDDIVEAYVVFRHGKNVDAVAAGYIGAALSALMVQARFEDLVAWAN